MVRFSYPGWAEIIYDWSETKAGAKKTLEEVRSRLLDEIDCIDGGIGEVEGRVTPNLYKGKRDSDNTTYINAPIIVSCWYPNVPLKMPPIGQRDLEIMNSGSVPRKNLSDKKVWRMMEMRK